MKKVVVFFLGLFMYTGAGAVAVQSITFNVTGASCMGGSDGRAEVILNGYQPPYYYSWSNGQTTPQATGLSGSTYIITITYGPNSLDTTLNVIVPELTCVIGAELKFTPNADGINDEWDINNLAYYPDFVLIVYNRWGQKVHEQKDTYEPWDGIYLGSPLPSATYYYVIYPYGRKNNEDIIKGQVTLIH
jgi:gliding motility-associated-like protein